MCLTVQLLIIVQSQIGSPSLLQLLINVVTLSINNGWDHSARLPHTVQIQMLNKKYSTLRNTRNVSLLKIKAAEHLTRVDKQKSILYLYMFGMECC